MEPLSQFLRLPKINSQIVYVWALREWVFQQPIATMPISDYANAFFLAHRNRVTFRNCTFAPSGAITSAICGACPRGGEQYRRSLEGIACTACGDPPRATCDGVRNCRGLVQRWSKYKTEKPGA